MNVATFWLWCLMPLLQYFSYKMYIMAVSFIGGGKQRKPAASCWQTISNNVVSSTLRNEQDSELATQVVMGRLHCSCIYNYHTITTASNHVGLSVGLTDTILKVDNLRMTIYFRYNIPTLQFAKKKSKFSRKHLK